MKTATFEQLNKIVANNILNDPIYNKILQLVRKKLNWIGIRDDIIPSSKAIKYLFAAQRNMDLMAPPPTAKEQRTFKTKEETQKIKMKTQHMLRAMSMNLPVEDDTEDQSPLVMLGLLVSMARRNQKLTIEELAIITNLEFETLFLIENGLASMDLVSEHLENICNSVGLDYHMTSSTIIDLILK